MIAHVRHQDKAHLIADRHEVLDLDNPFHTPEQFQLHLTKFIDQWGKRYPSIRGSLPEYKWRYYHQYLNYPVQLRRMLYTTNWIERFNKEVRKTTQHVNSFPNPDAAAKLDIYDYQTNGGKNLSNTYNKFLSLQTTHGKDLIWPSSDTELLTLPILHKQLTQTRILLENAGSTPKQVIADLGFRGVDADNPEVEIIHRGKYKSLTKPQRRWLRRRQAVEPAIGHLKSDHRMDRC